MIAVSWNTLCINFAYNLTVVSIFDVWLGQFYVWSTVSETLRRKRENLKISHRIGP